VSLQTIICLGQTLRITRNGKLMQDGRALGGWGPPALVYGTGEATSHRIAKYLCRATQRC